MKKQISKNNLLRILWSRDPICRKTTITSPRWLDKDWTILYSLTEARTIAVSKDTDVGEYQPQVMEEIETYKIRFFSIRTSTVRYSIAYSLLCAIEYNTKWLQAVLCYKV